MAITAAQQTALQNLVGRALTSTEVTMANNRQDGLLAASLSVGLTAPQIIPCSSLIGWLAQNGLRSMIWDAARTSGSTYYATRRNQALAIEDIIANKTDLDVSSSAIGQANVAMLNSWATVLAGETAAPLTSAQVSSLLSLGSAPVTISSAQVTAILG